MPAVGRENNQSLIPHLSLGAGLVSFLVPLLLVATGCIFRCFNWLLVLRGTVGIAAIGLGLWFLRSHKTQPDTTRIQTRRIIAMIGTFLGVVSVLPFVPSMLKGGL